MRVHKHASVLTGAQAVVGVDYEDAYEEELHAPPCSLPQERAARGAPSQHGVNGQGYGCPHDEHKPGRRDGRRKGEREEFEKEQIKIGKLVSVPVAEQP